MEELSGGRVDLTIGRCVGDLLSGSATYDCIRSPEAGPGSALDLFGGTRVRYADCVAWNAAHPLPAAATAATP